MTAVLVSPGNYGNENMNINKNSNKKERRSEERKRSRVKIEEIESRRRSIEILKESMAQNLERLPSKLDDEEDEEEEEEEGIDEKATTEGGYDPKEFESIDGEPEVIQLFSNILLYTPSSIELDYKLKPFIPEYIPTVGDIDAFIKVPRPDGQDDGVGLLVLDEPSATKQSDPALLALRFRALTKEVPQVGASDGGSGVIVGGSGVIVGGSGGIVSSGSERVKEVNESRDIDDWIENLGKLHQETSGVFPVQSQRLPDIENLMQEWDPEFEEVLDSNLTLPPPDLDCDLPQYVTILCSLLDIPVHGSKIASLHQLFTLYNEFRSSQHFN